MLTSIVIPTVNNPEALARVQRLLELNTPEEHEVIVVDTSPEPLGYVATSNLGLWEAVGDVLVVMNDDCQPEPGWLPPLLRSIEQGAWLTSPNWNIARLGGHCLVMPRESFEFTGGFDLRYHHCCADHHMELILIDAGKPIWQTVDSHVTHDPQDPLRIHHRKSMKLGNHEDLPNTGQWYNEDQAVFESIWGERRHHDHWPQDWSKP